MKKKWQCEICGSYQVKLNRVYKRFCSSECADNGDVKIWSDDEIELLQLLYSNSTLSDLQKLLSRRSLTSIKSKAETLHLHRIADDSWTKEEELRLGSLYQNTSRTDIMKHLPNRTWVAIKIHAGKIGLHRAKTNYRLANIGKLLNATNESYYWNGFLLADGHFTGKRVALALALKDKCHLEQFGRFVEYSGEIWQSKTACKIACMDATIVPTIMQFLNVVSNKTYYPPKLLPICSNNDQLLSLIIGFIDGDGCMQLGKKRNTPNISVKCHASWMSILGQMAEYVYVLSGERSGNVKINKKGYAVWCISKASIVKFLKEITIRLNLPVLNRKWRKIHYV